MIKTKRPERRSRKIDWYPDREYLHFDRRLSRTDAEALVTNPDKVVEHAFLPLISFNKIERKYRRRKALQPEIKTKIRKLAYCSNKDACIFAYYARLLNEPYEALIRQLGIDDVVIGYRRIGSNIDLAMSAFQDIATRGSCVAFAYDISGFFDNIVHAVLKRNWARVLDTDKLPDDHYKVFRNLTKFSTVDRRACLRRLGEKPGAKDSEVNRRPLCPIAEFRQSIRSDVGPLPNLVVPWKRDYRIPQGTPLSALAANISMIEFDVDMRKAIVALGGTYRRYSDDILIVVPSTHRSGVPALMDNLLKLRTRRLKVKPEKTEIIEFIPGGLAKGAGTKALQYLGFIFDGQNRFLRSSTLAKYHRRMYRAVGSAKLRQHAAITGSLPGRSKIYKRSLLASLTHLGGRNFVTGYAADASSKMGGKAIKKQLSGHYQKLQALLDR